MSSGSGKEMSVSGGGSGGGKGLFSGGVKIVKFVVTIAVLLVMVKMIDPIMSATEATADAGGQFLGGLTDLMNQIAAAFQDMGGGQ